MTIQLTSQITAISIMSNLNKSTDAYNNSMSRLSSGNKYTSISDAPVQITQSIYMQGEISANKKADTNVQQGQDLLNIADSTQEGVISNLQRIHDLCTQAANDSYSSSDKDAILTEIKQRLGQINSTADSTNYNGIKLFDGNISSLKIQVGLNSQNTIDVGSAFTNLHVSQLGGSVNGLKIPDTVNGSNWTHQDINDYMVKVNTAIDTLADNCAISGGYTNRLESQDQILTVGNQNLSSGKSTLTDTDFATESTKMVQYQILQQAAASILTQANQINGMALSLLK